MRGWNETEENKEMGEEEKNITTSPSTTSRDVMKLVCGFFFSRYLVYTWCDAVCGSPFPDSYAIVPWNAINTYARTHIPVLHFHKLLRESEKKRNLARQRNSRAGIYPVRKTKSPAATLVTRPGSLWRPKLFERDKERKKKKTKPKCWTCKETQGWCSLNSQW